jgi:tetratricopeptide (TPR) repeat protein
MKIKSILLVAALIACYACETKTEVKTEPVRVDHLAKGNDYFLKSDFENAIAELDSSIKDSATATAFYSKGVIFDLQGNYQAAIELYSKAINADPNFTLAYYKRANCKRMVGDASALADLKRAVELKPDFVGAIVDVAHMEAPQGNATKVIIDMLSKSIQSQPNSYFLYNYRGIQRYSSGDNKGAIEDFDQVLKLNPTSSEAYYYRGIINGEAKEYAKSVADLSKAIELKSDYKTAYFYRGIYNYNLEKKEDACKDFAKAKELGEATAQKYINDLCGAK